VRASALVLAALLGCGARTGFELSSSPSDAAGATDASPGDAGASSDAACKDGGPLELVYVFDEVGVLYRYDPLTGHSEALGTPNCGNSSVPWTMTVSSDTAYVVYTDWTLYAVNLATLACSPTPFQAGQLGFEPQFGVAISGTGASERLFVYGLPSGSSNPILAVSDTVAFNLTRVGDIQPAPPPSSFPVNLTADATGNLYAFSPLGLVQKIDSATGTVLESVDTGVTSTSTWATIAYGPDLFLWVESNVVGYDLSSRTQTSDMDAGVYAIGAGSFLACPGE
jgi:hypothetical protein